MFCNSNLSSRQLPYGQHLVSRYKSLCSEKKNYKIFLTLTEAQKLLVDVLEHFNSLIYIEAPFSYGIKTAIVKSIVFKGIIHLFSCKQKILHINRKGDVLVQVFYFSYKFTFFLHKV